jgi:thiol:disulfide interchange protein/DsbC/DsbD-like thiol-disulfide interchange protein
MQVYKRWPIGHLCLWSRILDTSGTFGYNYAFRNMTMHRPLFISLLALCLVSAAFSQTPRKEHHTRIKLLANVKSVKPGGEFLVGVLMTMDEGWHTYWKNPGEAGLATEINWSLPRGFSAGDIRWPLPHKYNESGEVLTYGYEKENMLIVPIKTLSSISQSKITLKADVSWLECEKICVPGSASVELTLPVMATEPEADNAVMFGTYTSMVPGPFVGMPGLEVSATPQPGGVEILLRSRDALVRDDVVPDFYPEAIPELAMGRTQVEYDPHRARLWVPLSVYEKVSLSLDLPGVLLYQMAGKERVAATISVRLPQRFVSGLSVAGESPSNDGLLDQTFSTVQTHSGEFPLYLYFVFALVGGLLLNIMPCVLPVIALKIFGLVRMAGDKPARVRRLGWTFSAGILASFLVLASLVIVLQSAGEQVGWGFQFQEPYFVIAMSAVVFAFGLSLFGVFEVGLPFVLAFASVGTAMEKKEGEGYVASFTEGIFATILATPCTAPFLGTALGFAFSQPVSIILLIFSTVGLGMALPYLVLTTRPAWMKFLPKPGQWMVTVKQFMGFLMMGTLIWLLYVLGKQLGMEAVIWTSAFLLCIGIACWLVGQFATLSASRFRYFSVIGVAVAIVVGGYLFFMESVLDIRSVMAGVAAPSPGKVEPAKDGIQWQPFSLASLENHLKENKAVFIDFTAEWCLTCKVNEKTVLTNREVVEKFKSHDLVAVKADWTNRNPDITRLLAKFGRSGVPLYVIFPAGRPTEPIVLPEVITSGIVLDAIDRAQSKAASRIPAAP